MVATKKICCNCGESKPIWKTDKRDRYCKTCWFRLNPVAPIAQKTPIKKAATKIKPRSKKKAKEDTQYSKLRVTFFSIPGNEFCKANLPGCQHQACDVHHIRGRGIYYLIMEWWLPVCRHCHDWIGANSKLAMAMGFIKTRLTKARTTHEKV